MTKKMLTGKVIKDKDQQARLSHDLATLAPRHAQELAKGQSPEKFWPMKIWPRQVNN